MTVDGGASSTAVTVRSDSPSVGSPDIASTLQFKQLPSAENDDVSAAVAEGAEEV